MKIKVLCNDNPRFAEIKRAAVEKDPEAEVSGGAWRIEELSAFIDGSGPDVLIIDQATPACLETLEILSQRRPDIDVLLIATETSVEFLMRAMRANVREVLPITITTEALQEAIGRIRQKRSHLPGMRGEGKVLAFISCKGGSGATFIAANLAYALAAERKQRVALIDLNLLFGDVAMFVSEQIPPSNVAEVAREINRLDAFFLESAMLEVAPGLHVLASPDDPSSAPDVKREHVDAIIRLARSKYDFVIVDVARTLDTITLQALDMADLIFPVLQLTLPFIRDSKRLINVFRSLDYHPEQIRLIVNRYRKGGEISLTDIERTVGLKVFTTLPNSYQATATSVNLGVPIIKGQRTDPVSKALIEMAYMIVPADEEEASRGGWLSRVFS
ncbi:AAA family ATPase [Uliginosibacterium flavum]|uniref:AAA family ATPase n=1 Tax=Uliginosibacterium flavum TaxID=1396831 RepID=A0ABV2TIR8_9RHOO